MCNKEFYRLSIVEKFKHHQYDRLSNGKGKSEFKQIGVNFKLAI